MVTEMSLTQTAAPTGLAVTLAEAKLHTRVDTADDDALLTSMIIAAQDSIEQEIGRSLLTQTWALSLCAFPAQIKLTRPPINAVTSITYTDTSGAPQTLATDQYVLVRGDEGDARVIPAYLAVWPDTQPQEGSVVVTYTAGYTTVPEALKAWIKLMVSAMYENRDAESYSARAVSTTVKMSFVRGLLAKYRVTPL